MYTKYKVNNIIIIQFNSNTFTNEIKKKIDKLIIQICEGSKSFRLNWLCSESKEVSITKIKKELYQRIMSKSLSTQKGMISEFFVHLVLNQEKFKQEFLFFNISTRSIKNGFDGIYSRDKELWIVDCKSGDSKTKNITHDDKISEAYENVKGLLDGTGTTNDVWAEAWHNIDLKSVNTSLTICKAVKKYRLDAENGNALTVDKANIIPSSTIFTRTDKSHNIHSNYKFNGKESIFKKPNRKIILFHATNKMYIEFLKYLKGS